MTGLQVFGAVLLAVVLGGLLTVFLVLMVWKRG